MKVAVLGTGVVGRTIATKLISLGHEVRLGSRTSDNPVAADWVTEQGQRAGAAEFFDACTFGEIVFNCLPGSVCLSVLAGVVEAIGDKVLVDVSNPLDFSNGFPPSLSVVNTDSLAEQIQRALPRAKVVKSLNTMNADVMVSPGVLAERSEVFVAGEDADAKEQVRSLLREFGWDAANILDLGGIGAARGSEMYLPLWLALMGSLGTAAFNVRVVREPGSTLNG